MAGQAATTESRHQSRAIAVVEPQMEQLFHTPFNAALLHAVALAYPDVPVSFRGFPEHLRIVRQILQENAPELDARIEWRVTPLSTAKSAWQRWRASGQRLREALASGERVLFCSVSRMQLLQLKRSMRVRDNVRAVLHGDLSIIERPPLERFPMSLFSLHRVLLRPNPAGLRYIVLGETIRSHIPPAFREAMANTSAIESPYHFAPLQPPVQPPPGGLIFGTFGNTGEARLLEAVARKVRELNSRIRFRLVGFLLDDPTMQRLEGVVEDIGLDPISRESFITRAESLTHTLWLAPPDSPKLRASGSFLDALSYAKPLVYTKNSYIDPFHALEPAIGLRCETLDEVPEAILHLAAAYTAENYASARAAILRLRERFTPEALAGTLPAALDWD